MPDSTAFPHATHLNIRYAPLEIVDVPALVEANRERWYNQTLCQLLIDLEGRTVDRPA